MIPVHIDPAQPEYGASREVMYANWDFMARQNAKCIMDLNTRDSWILYLIQQNDDLKSQTANPDATPTTPGSDAHEKTQNSCPDTGRKHPPSPHGSVRKGKN